MFIKREVKKLLDGRSNIEVKPDGRIWIRSNQRYLSGKGLKVKLQSDRGQVLKYFDTLTQCGEFLGISYKKVSLLIKNNQEAIIVDNIPYYIKYN